MKLDVTCRDPDCRSKWNTRVSWQVFKNGRVRLRVDCEEHGVFSHYVKCPELEQATRELVALLRRAANAAVAVR